MKMSLENEDATVRLYFGNEEEYEQCIVCRRSTICRLSDYFKALFQHKMTEGLSGEAHFYDISFEVGSVLIGYAQLIFEQQMDPSNALSHAGIASHNLRTVIRLSDRFQIDILINVSDGFLIELMSGDVDSVDLVDWFIFATNYSLISSLEILTGLILCRFRLLPITSFAALSAQSLRLIFGNSKLNSHSSSDERHIMNCLLIWVIVHCESDSEKDLMLVDLLKNCLDYNLLQKDPDVLLDFHSKESMVRSLPRINTFLLNCHYQMRDGFFNPHLYGCTTRIWPDNAIGLFAVGTDLPQVRSHSQVDDAIELFHQEQPVQQLNLAMVNLVNAQHKNLSIPTDYCLDGAALCTYNGILYTSGGLHKNGLSASDHVYSFDTVFRQWRQINTLPVARWKHQSWFGQNQLFIAGGFSDFEMKKPLNDMWSLDINSHTWKRWTDMPIDHKDQTLCSICNEQSFWGQCLLVDDTLIFHDSEKLYQFSYALDEWSDLNIWLPMCVRRARKDSNGLHVCGGLRWTAQLFADNSNIYLVHRSHNNDIHLHIYDSNKRPNDRVSDCEERAGHMLELLYERSGPTEQKWRLLIRNPCSKSVRHDMIPMFIRNSLFYFCIFDVTMDRKSISNVRLVSLDLNSQSENYIGTLVGVPSHIHSISVVSLYV